MRKNRQPLKTRILSVLLGVSMWVLWIWLIIPAQVSDELRRRIVETSLWPSVHVVITLVLLYVGAVISGRSRAIGAADTPSEEFSEKAAPAIEIG
jgi:hypothetical protein